MRHDGPKRARSWKRRTQPRKVYSASGLLYSALATWSRVPRQFRWGWLRTFKTKAFARFTNEAGIRDAALCDAVRDAERGLIVADLGGGVIKQRIARHGQGKSGGFGTLIVFRTGSRAFFVHGFAKNKKGNIEKDEFIAVKKLA